MYFYTRDELIAVCKGALGLPPYGKLLASSEKVQKSSTSCSAEDGFIVTSKGWCSKQDNGKNLPSPFPLKIPHSNQ